MVVQQRQGRGARRCRRDVALYGTEAPANEPPKVLCIGKQDKGKISFDENNFHMWVQTEHHIVDFHSPLFGDGVNGPFTVCDYRVLVTPSGRAKEPAAIDLGRLDWADWDHDGSLLYATDGGLYRRDVAGRAADAPRVKRVADLRDQLFENVRAPDEARRWP